MTKSDIFLPNFQEDSDDSESSLQVTCDVDGIIAALDYDSFELLPGTVNARAGMRFADDAYDIQDSPDSLVSTPEEFISDNSGMPSMYAFPSPVPCWGPPFDLPQNTRRRRKKNKKRKSQRRQLARELEAQQRVVSPAPSTYVSDGSSESPMNSPMKQRLNRANTPSELLLAKKAKKKRNKQRRRRARARESLSFSTYDIDLVTARLNGMNMAGFTEYSPQQKDSYASRPHIFARGPLFISHPMYAEMV